MKKTIIALSLFCAIIFTQASTANQFDELSEETIQMLLHLNGVLHTKLDNEMNLHNDHDHETTEFIDYHFGKIVAYTDMIIVINDILRNN